MHLKNLVEEPAGHPVIRTSWVGSESGVDATNGHMDFGCDVYIPMDGRVSGKWDGYPIRMYKSAREPS